MCITERINPRLLLLLLHSITILYVCACVCVCVVKAFLTVAEGLSYLMSHNEDKEHNHQSQRWSTSTKTSTIGISLDQTDEKKSNTVTTQQIFFGNSAVSSSREGEELIRHIPTNHQGGVFRLMTKLAPSTQWMHRCLRDLSTFLCCLTVRPALTP